MGMQLSRNAVNDAVSTSLRRDSRLAIHWRLADEGGDRVQCNLCPRECKPRAGQTGFCRVRQNIDGRLHTLNYGKSVAATEEVIETEAIYHFSPGRRILSLGNIGCMMACDFCQNWETSQIRHLNASVVRTYTPQQVLRLCQEHGIEMVSWTYNDPVVWHEFVCDTSRLLRTHGIRTLYKSAMYIQEEPTRELLDVIDIFSISLKSLDADFYRKITKGELGPVLERTRQVHASGRHLEVSQLVIPNRNDQPRDIARTVAWVLENLGDEVPLHFVGFHPAYRYTDVERTSTESLLKARGIALEAGVKYCYLGNVYRDGVSDTHCTCGQTLVARYGLTSSIIGITPQGHCSACGRHSPIRHPWEASRTNELQPNSRVHATGQATFHWTDDVSSVHLTLDGRSDTPPFDIIVRHGDAAMGQHLRLGGGLQRVIVSKQNRWDREIQIEWNGEEQIQILPVLDRAHFPVAGWRESSPRLEIESLPTTKEVA